MSNKKIPKEYVLGIGVQPLLEVVQNYVLRNKKFDTLTSHERQKVIQLCNNLRQLYQKVSHAYSVALGTSIEMDGLTPKVNEDGDYVFKSDMHRDVFVITVDAIYKTQLKLTPCHFLPKDFFDELEADEKVDTEELKLLGLNKLLKIDL